MNKVFAVWFCGGEGGGGGGGGGGRTDRHTHTLTSAMRRLSPRPEGWAKKGSVWKGDWLRVIGIG